MMSTAKTILSLALALMMAAACGGGSDGETSGATTDEGGVTVEADLYLTVSDTIGVEMGDSNYVFGVIAGAGYSPDGSTIGIIDQQKLGLFLYDADGQFLQKVGGHGSGPGEYLMPSSFSFIPGGGMVIADAMGSKLIFYDSTYTYSHELSGFFPTPPVALIAIGDSTMVGLKPEFEQTNEGMFMGYTLARWSQDDPEPIHVYSSEMNPFDPSDPSSMLGDNMFFFFATPDGRIFKSPLTTQQYLVEGYTLEGEIFLSIEREFESVRKTDAEIEEEKEFIRQRMIASGAPEAMAETWDPEPFKYATAGVYVDWEDRIWVRLGYTDIPVFEVFDSEGNHLFVVAFDQEMEYDTWQIIVTPQGILGFDANPDDYSRLYLMELNE